MATENTPLEWLSPAIWLEKLKRFGGSFVPGNIMRDLFVGAAYNETTRAVWRDMVADLARTPAAANAPTFTTMISGLQAYSFSAASMNQLFVSFHIDHDILRGSKIYPHVHWTPGSSTDTGTVRWGIEYTVAAGHGRGEFGASTTIYLEQAGPGVAHRHMIVEASDEQAIDAPEIDSLIVCRVFRDAAHANDTFAAACFGLYMDMHYQADRVGTPQKSPDFYKENFEL